MLLVQLLFGTGMRSLEALRLRVQDLDLTRRDILIRNGKGVTDRVTILPDSLVEPLETRLQNRRQEFEVGCADVWLPRALAVKYSRAGSEWAWQYVFVARKYSTDSRSGAFRRHHLDERLVRRAVKRAAMQAEISRPVSPHTLQHSLAMH